MFKELQLHGGEVEVPLLAAPHSTVHQSVPQALETWH